jgi:hypothetical protein
MFGKEQLHDIIGATTAWAPTGVQTVIGALRFRQARRRHHHGGGENRMSPG